MRKQNQLGQWQPTKAARRASLLLFILSAAFITAGTYGWLMGDWNLESLRPIAAEVYEARRVARSFEQPITGTVDLFGEGRGTVPIALLSLIMNNAIVIIILGITFLVNAIMLRIQSWERMKDFMCVQPALIFFLLFVYYPVIDLVRISFTDMRMLVPDPQEFIGFKNYEWLFLKSGWNRFSESLLITARYTFWELFITLVGGLLLALLFNRMNKTFNAMRAVVFMPKYIAVATSAVVFIWILHGNHGILNYVLSLFGIKGPNWLVQADTALMGILILTTWRVVGYAMMIYLSAMQGIPKDYYEAAEIDGADSVQRFRFITLPMLAPTTLFLFVTTFIASMKVFQSVDVMTGGGPGTATNVLVQWIYNLSFRDFRAARSAAVSVIFFIILLITTAATMRWSNRSVSYDS
ncbi:carbohydrate ABC transporter permease [Candidatus Darwinibacter acetoxidans]|nr:sugar ABC transporter permease [Bacillota bacterium]